MSEIPQFDPTDARTTQQRSADWARTTVDELSRPRQYFPPKTWTYYAAIVIAVIMLVCAVTGIGSVVIAKGQKMFQRYAERMYGFDETAEPSRAIVKPPAPAPQFKILLVKDKNRPLAIGRLEVDDGCQLKLKRAAKPYRMQLIDTVDRVNQMTVISTDATNSPSLVERASPEFFDALRGYMEKRYDLRLSQVQTNR